MKKDEGRGRTWGWSSILPWAIGGAVLACYAVLVCGSYYIHATSDPHNWLVFAQHFVEEFGKSRWPYGYPLYLKGMLAAVGPYWVFLANLPAILGMYLLAGWIGTMFAADDTPPGGDGRKTEKAMPRSWGFLAVWVVVLGVDSVHQMTYLNPYRDPLSYLFLLASVGVFVRSLAAGRTWGVGAAGTLLGLACSVREPSVLMLLPLFAYGLLAWRGGKAGAGLWRNVVAFVLGMVVGVSPMMVQSYLSTHQVLLPHNMLLNESGPPPLSEIIPGMHLDGAFFAQVGGQALGYYTRTEPFLLSLALVGLVAAVWKKNRLVLAVVVPSAVGFALFYAFYHSFFYRYYYVALLFLALLAGYGLLSLLRILHARIRPPCVGLAAGWCLLAAVAGVTSCRLLSERAVGQPLQIPQARAMAAAIREICPDADVIYSARPFCEWIDWFLGCESHPFEPSIPAHIRSESQNDGPPDLHGRLARRLAQGEKLYAAVWFRGKPGETEIDTPDVRRVVDRHLAGSFDPARFAAGYFLGETVNFYRLASWSNLTVNLDWHVPERGAYGGAYWFMVDPGDWDAEHAPADISPGGTPGGALVVPHGGAWVGGAQAGESDYGSKVECSISSPDPLPREIPVRTGALDDPIELDFRPYGTFGHQWRWKGDVQPSNPPRSGIGIRSAADLEVPVPWPGLADTAIEVVLVAERKVPEISIPVIVSEGDHQLARVRIRGDRLPTRLLFPLPYDPVSEARYLHFDTEVQPAPKTYHIRAPIGIECIKATVLRWARTVEYLLPPPPESACRLQHPRFALLRLDVPECAEGTALRVKLDGRLLAEGLDVGCHFLAVPPELLAEAAEDGMFKLQIEADGPIPEDFRPEWLHPDAPMEMSFGKGGAYAAGSCLSDEFRKFDEQLDADGGWKEAVNMREFGGDGEIRLPEGLEDVLADYAIDISMATVYNDPNGRLSVTVSLPEFPDIAPVTDCKPYLDSPQSFHFVFKGLPRSPRVLRIHSDCGVEFPKELLGNPHHANVKIGSLSVQTHPEVESLHIRVGDSDDGILLGDGYFSRERTNTPEHGRWTQGRSEVYLPIGGRRDYRLELVYSQHRPRSVPPVEPRVSLNGHPLEAEVSDTGLACRIPSEWLGVTNLFLFETDTWRPSAHGVPDNRHLGVFLRDIRVTPY